jgi:putative DNA primase/helicase
MSDALDEAVAVAYGEDPHVSEEERFTDIGNARRFAREHAGAVRYCYPWESWLYFDGGRWTKDESGEVERRAKQTIEGMYAEAAGLIGDDRKDLLKHALRTESAGRVTSMIALARSELPILVADLDRDQWLLNVSNGTIDLKSGALREHRAEDFITKIAPVDYDPEATCPKFEAFLHTVFAGRRPLIDFVQRVAGYSTTGVTSEQKLILEHGGGANGKTTLNQAIETAMGDYAQSTPPETLMIKYGDDGGPSEDVARLHGARFVSSVETADGRRLAESKVKQLTGGDKVTARYLYGHYFEFRPTFKLWYATNHLPTVRGQDEAIWRRILKIPFDVTIPEPERIPDYFEKFLAPELPGILTWAVVGCLLWQSEGLNPPDEVRKATSDYRNDQDVVGAFISDSCSTGPNERELAGRLYKGYRNWCDQLGEKPMTNQAFGRRLTDRGFQALDSGGKWRIGIALIHDNQTSFEATR